MPPLHGYGAYLINKTAAASVRGSIVADTTTDFGFDLAATNAIDAFGVVYDEGVADGGRCFVILGGVCQVLLEDQTAATRGNWVGVSTAAAGRADATAASPANQTRHFQEIGHCIESVSAGGPGELVLATIVMHFN